MTASATLAPPTTPPCTCDARTTSHSPRERWRYVGREVHYGHVYDVWMLVANPQGWHVIGSKRGQLVEDAA